MASISDLLSSDVVTEYAFARSEHHLEAEDFNPWMLKAAVGTSSLGQIAKHAYWFFWLIMHIPDSIAERLDPNGTYSQRRRHKFVPLTSFFVAMRYVQFKRVSHPIRNFFFHLIPSRTSTRKLKTFVQA
jgi:hypothetical protein